MIKNNVFKVFEPTMSQKPVVPVKKKRSWCCCGCLMIILLIVLLIGGFMRYAYLKYRPAPSPVEQEYKDTPDYFPPPSGMLHLVEMELLG